MRISHRRFATSCLEVRIIMRRIVNERNTKRKKSSDYIKENSRRRNVRDTGGRHDGNAAKKQTSVQSESVSENDNIHPNFCNGYLLVIDGITEQRQRMP